jgi:hypothetical protein
MTLPPSTPLHLLASRGSCAYVETFTGVRGWVNTADTATLAPNGTEPGVPLIISFK